MSPWIPSSPTILFIGESVMFGEGLTWDESVPAQVGAMMGIQSANLAVHGFGSDQAYLRLETELPRFRRPVAVVSLFMTALFGRNLDDDRPHLGPGLVWLPAEQHGRLASLAKLLVPYRTDDTVERGVTMTRDVLRATVDLARARGATPLIVVPQFGPEEAGRTGAAAPDPRRDRLAVRLDRDRRGLAASWDLIPTRAPLTRSPPPSQLACKGAREFSVPCRSPLSAVRARNGQRSANASGRILMATSRSSRASRARYTSPIPPAPMAERISYGPRCVPGAMATVCEADYTGRTPIRRDYSA